MTIENAQTLAAALAKLTPIQRKAVDWGEGALLALAGPGSGKTQVLTCRIARLLDASRGKRFRVLALTFTNKAADEMLMRVQGFVPGLEERASIGTFHSFCTQVLRQHGVHLEIRPDFTIYALDNDRVAVLEDALRRAMTRGKPVSLDDVRYLSVIDKLKARLIDPEKAPAVLAKLQDSERIATVYQCYEAELQRVNALDFNSLIFQTHRLATTFPAIAMQYRRSHPYWLIDEFQDTNDAQYRLVRAMAGEGFRNVFAVADDDQIIYQWNGASFRQLQRFRVDFEPELVQLPTNYRCPPAIVEAANRLVAYNVQRTDAKLPLVAGKTELKLPAKEHIRLGHYDNEEVEAQRIAADIAGRPAAHRGEVAVLARTRALLERVCKALHEAGVPAAIAQRRDDFLSAEFRWLVACLRQALRPLDRRNLVTLVEAFNRLGETQISADQIMADAEASGRSYLTEWLTAAISARTPSRARGLLEAVTPLTQNTSGYAPFIASAIASFGYNDEEASIANDLAEDIAAWREINLEISRHLGRHPDLDHFLQELGLRSKEPSPKSGTVTLMTIHGAKGREFDFVYVLGLAEDVMPSYQSRQKGDSSAEMEEERRNCFVAITRAKEGLTLSWADRDRGYGKRPSRFLVEMGFISTAA